MIKRNLAKRPGHEYRQTKNPPPWTGPAFIALLGTAIYANSFSCAFHFDDLLHIVNNNAIRNLADAGTWWNYLPNRPVSVFTFVLNYHLFGLEVGSWHLVNLVIHIFNAFLVRWFTLLILSTPAMEGTPVANNKNLVALLTALLFVSHPLATQSVTYIIQRMNSLATLFYLLSLVFYIKGRMSDRGVHALFLWFSGSALAAILSMLSKENGYTVPLALLAVEMFFLRKESDKVNFRNPRLLIPVTACLAVAVWVLVKFPLSVFDPIPPRSGHAVALTPWNYLLTQFSVVVKYIQLLVLPVNQHLEYDFPVAESFFVPVTLASFFFLLSLIILAVYLFRRERLISFGIAWFFLTLSVESGIIPLDDVIVEHRTYLPSVGFFLVLATLINLLWTRYRLMAVAVSALIIGSWSCLTFQRNTAWKDNLSLLSDNIEKAPEFARPYSNRGVVYWKRNERARAISDFSRAIEINPGYRDAWYNRGVVYEEIGEFERAVADFSRAIEIDSTHTGAYYNRGVAYFRLGETGKAIDDYSRVIRIDSGYVTAWNNRGVVYVNLREYDKAMADFSRAIDIRPDYADAWSNRGAACNELGRYDQAITDYTRALELNPANKETWVNRAIVFGNRDQWEKAVADYTRALEIDPGYERAVSNRETAFGKLKNQGSR